MITKTKLKQRKRKKTHSELVETLEFAAKNKGWMEVGAILSRGRKDHVAINLKRIEEGSSEGDTIVIPGKVLSDGKLTKKVRICALGFSKEAEEKIKKIKAEAKSILEEMKKNAKGEGIKIIR